MQTFLVSQSFERSAFCLDRQRLGKQRSEVLQLLQALEDPKNKLHKHPACVMWWGFKDALVAYGLTICDEWTGRGYDDSVWGKIVAFKTIEMVPTQDTVPLPKWIGNEQFHASHRGNLLRKDFKYYSQFGWTDSPLLPYVWPVNHDPRLFI